MDETKNKGEIGEQLAVEYLASLGYSIIERNWKYKKDEIDIIAQDGNILVFVEVKTRSEGYLLEPSEAVTRRKQSFLIRAANAYFQQSGSTLEARFDVVTVVMQPDKKPVITLIKDAFYPIAKSR